MKKEYIVAGLMSGTSLDGLDIALCRFVKDEIWSFEIIDALTFEYDGPLKEKLAWAHTRSAEELALLHTELGILHGTHVSDFLQKQNLKADFVSSHGHTVFHQPAKSMTLQIGSAPHIAALTHLPVVADFRTTDVAHGGQGAPLVPIGDLHLFPDQEYCLNLGGIANVSIKNPDKKSITAFDICVCNIALNHLAQQHGEQYDAGGQLAAKGKVDEQLLAALNEPHFYHQRPPKSLGKEFFDTEVFPLIHNTTISIEDRLRTFTEHIAVQIGTVLPSSGKMLVTGGGVFNSFLIERIKAHTAVEIIIPEKNIIQFKEAIIFAFLGVLRWRGEENCLASVTGASRDCCGGAIYLP